MKLMACFLLALPALLAQTSASTGSVSGRLLDADSGSPISDFPIERNVRTDDHGYYKITGIKPGPFEIRLRGDRVWPELIVTSMNVEAGQELTGVDLRIRLDGEISGRVVDQYKSPVDGVLVRVIGREYHAGALYYFSENSATTNDRGEYVIRNVRAGRVIALLVEKRRVFSGPLADVPADPKLRRAAYRATYYPNAESADGAAFFALRSAERRQNMDIQVLRSPAYCVDGTILLDGAPASLEFKVTDERSSSANMTPGSGSSGATGVSSGTDGKFRVCDFYPGQFRIAALKRTGAATSAFGSSSVTIANEDIHNLRIAATAAVNVPGEIAWEGSPPDATAALQFAVSAESITNDSMLLNRPKFSIPGPFTFSALQTVEYQLQLSFAPRASVPNAYIKDVTYGPISILHQRFRWNGEGTVRVTLANDGGKIQATAPPGAWMVVLPKLSAPEAVIAHAMIIGQADPSGSYTSPVIAPASYILLATTDPVDFTPECVGTIWRVRARGQEVTVGPNATAPVTIRDLTRLKLTDR